MALSTLDRADSGLAREAAQLSPGNSALLGLLKKERAKMVESRADDHEKWPAYDDLALGDHYPEAAFPGDAQVTWNITGRNQKVIIALLIAGRVRAEAIGKNPMADMTARAYDARLQEIQDENDITAVQQAVLEDTLSKGTGAFYTWYDEQAKGGYGDYRIDHFDIYDLFVDRHARNIRTVSVMALRKIMDLAKAEATWPEFKGRITEHRETSEDSSSGLYRPIKPLPNIRNVGRGNVEGERTDGSTWTSYGDTGRRSTAGLQEVHVWEYYVRADYAAAMFDPKVLSEEGQDQEYEADNENLMFRSGNWIEPVMKQDHAIHLNRHREDRQRYMGAMTSDERAMRKAHDEMHREMMGSREYRIMRASRYPGGWRMIQATDDLILYDGRTLTGIEELPISIVKNWNHNGRFWGTSESVDSEGLQHALNICPSELANALRLNVGPAMIVDKDCTATDEELAQRRSLVIRANLEPGVRAAEYLPVPRLDQIYIQAPNLLVDALNGQSGFSPVMEGIAPGSVQSGKAVGLLQQASQTRIVLRNENLKSGLVGVGRNGVALLHRFDKDPRLVRLQNPNPMRLPQGAMPSGSGDGSMFVPINGADGTNRLDSIQPQDLDVSVNANGTAAGGKHEVESQTMDMVEKGLLHPIVALRRLVTVGTIRQTEFEEQLQYTPPPGPPPPEPPPPPKVQFNIKGEIPPQLAIQMAPGQGGQAPPPPPEQGPPMMPQGLQEPPPWEQVQGQPQEPMMQ